MKRHGAEWSGNERREGGVEIVGEEGVRALCCGKEGGQEQRGEETRPLGGGTGGKRQLKE